MQVKMDKEMKAFKKETKKELNDIKWPKWEIIQIRKTRGELKEIKSEFVQFIKLATETDTKRKL